MKGFSTKDGDVIVAKTIEMCSGAELLRQKVELVLGTNKGEWAYDTEEGIEFPLILRKNPNKDEIRGTIEAALLRIDETFAMTAFDLTIGDRRKAVIDFKAVNADGVEVGGEYTYGGD